MTHTTRESWLTEACKLLEPTLQLAGVRLADVRVSCGWPARGALSRAKRRIGECWHGSNEFQAGIGQVFVSPCLDQPVEVLATLLHELIHAALPAKAKHGKGFAKVALRAGLEGKPTATVAGQSLTERLNADVLPVLGEYPHVKLDATSKLKTQTTRMRLYECECVPDKEAGTTNKVRCASDNLLATCGVCESAFVLQTPDERD